MKARKKRLSEYLGLAGSPPPVASKKQTATKKQAASKKQAADARAEATAQQMQAKAAEVKKLYQKSVEGIVAAGRVLRSFEEEVVARCFKSFVSDHLHWSRTQVYRMMWVYDRFNGCTTLGHFDLSALYTLSAPKCPQKATDEAIEMTDDGKHVTSKVAHDLVAKHSPEIQPTTQRTRSVLVSKSALQKAAKTRKIDVDKLVAVLKDVGVNVKWEAAKNIKEAA